MVNKKSALLALLLFAWGSAHATPISYVWNGTFTEVLTDFSTSDRGDALVGTEFSIAFTIPDSTTPDLVIGSGITYEVETSLALEGLGTFSQETDFQLRRTSTNTATIGQFSDVLTAGDNLGFGICTGGACVDNFLWNGSLLDPVLFTGQFQLGLDSSCFDPSQCRNAVMTWSSGQPNEGFVLAYTGELTVSSVPEPEILGLLCISLLGWGFTRRKRTS